MKRFAIITSFGLLSALIISGTSRVDAHKPLLGGHADHLWSEDSAAYRSYREPILTAKTFAPLAAPIEKIDGAYLESSLRILSGEKDPVMANRGKKAGRAAARVFLAKEFEAYGFKTHEENYGSGVNLVAERAGKSGKFLIVGAHYDSVNNPGADDDGTGVVAMLGTAKMLGERSLENGVRFVAFDEEELGLVGSAAYVKALVARGEKTTTIGSVTMEMMGYNSKKDGKFHVITCDRPDSQFLYDAFVRVVAEIGPSIQISTACTDRSDHASFWKKGIGAVVLSENFFGGDSNPCYHEACDTTKLIDFDYFRNVAEASANVVVQLAMTPPRVPPTEPTPPAPTTAPKPSESSWPSLH